MAMVAAGKRITVPKKLPMEETMLLARTLATALLDEEDEKAILLLRHLDEKYMLEDIFTREFKIAHDSRGHIVSIYCHHNSSGIKGRDYHTKYYLLEKHKNLDDMAANLLRDIIYMMVKANNEMGQDLTFSDYDGFMLIEQALFVELQEDIYKDL